ncbi:hypothetical protein BEP19_15665 [Ammoniphilus oxalaticus]|uniref:Uncharacterized protein n=1 Tax=Ammoniphilus oxalaticus TaxID=66863 RepID=A0A419SDP7_9BACL|nr:hypothetical protein [Ammoniphilus oxalaticus]RKD21110.1 hypothetical protein BEP19_15665 [Ammoniphilus oxalaticus]
MLTYEQAPLKRIAARQALEKGLITRARYNQILDELDRIERENKKSNDKWIRKAKDKIEELMV